MKTKVKGFNAIIFLILFIFPLTSFAQKKVEKTLDWKWEINDKTAISFINKIGDLEITTWNKNEVYLEADVVVKGKEEDVNLAIKKIQEMPVKHSDLSLEINSKFYDSWVQRSVIGIGNIKLRLLDGDKITLDELSVKYRLVVPENAIFSLQHKYEDLSMADLGGKISLELYDCDFEAGNVANDSKISMKYSKGSFKNLDDALLNVYDSKLTIEKTGDITFISKYSEATINESGNILLDSHDDEIYFSNHGDINGKAKYTEMECGDMDKSNLVLYDCKFKGGKVNEFFLESKYTEIYLVSAKNLTFTQSYDDVVTIDYVGDLSSNSKYTDYTFENLSNSISMSSYDDNITIINLEKDFSGIDMEWKYTDLIIGMSPEAKYKLNFDTKYTSLEYPKSKIKETYYHKENSEFKFRGIVEGADESNCATIKINGYDGKLVIK